MSIYTMKNKPYGRSVHEIYIDFIEGRINVYDEETGELFERNTFFKDGIPIEISESTVWNYINNGLNRVIVDSKRSGKLEFSSTHRPHHHRSKPVFSFSKVSMDDLDLQRKMHDGNRVKVYRAYDVASGCVIGKAYSRDKDRQLFIDCIRDMFQVIETNDFGVPMEVEVEHHIVNLFREGLMKAETVFPFVRWCNAGNSQEKHAEHFNKAKKYGVDKKYQTGIGRYYAKLEANRIKTEYGQKAKTYSYEELVADDIETTKEYNNNLHPNQKKYPGKTRWQVLCENLNPAIANPNKAILYKYIGERTQTSIRRSQYCQVRGEKYQLPSVDVLTQLKPNNNNVDAYYIPDVEGRINDIYLYQGDEFLCIANKIVKYNTAKAEETEADKLAYTDQAKYVSHFDKTVKEGKKNLIKPGIINVDEFEQINTIAEETVEVVNFEKSPDEFDLDTILKEYSPEDVRADAYKSM